MKTKRFTHDCDNCEFLGQFNEYDLYYCEDAFEPTVVARYGDDGPEYTSGIHSSNPALVEARSRALQVMIA
jgi:hypothetical protein